MVIVDAGHGGSDPGASSGDIVEKDYTLRISEYAEIFFFESGRVTIPTSSNVFLSVRVKFVILG